jgi:hypothetical protein
MPHRSRFPLPQRARSHAAMRRLLTAPAPKRSEARPAWRPSEMLLQRGAVFPEIRRLRLLSRAPSDRTSPWTGRSMLHLRRRPDRTRTSRRPAGGRAARGRRRCRHPRQPSWPRDDPLAPERPATLHRGTIACCAQPLRRRFGRRNAGTSSRPRSARLTKVRSGSASATCSKRVARCQDVFASPRHAAGPRYPREKRLWVHFHALLRV